MEIFAQTREQPPIDIKDKLCYAYIYYLLIE